MMDPTKTPGTTTSSTEQQLRPRKFVGDFRLGTTIGVGSMGKVKLAVNEKTGERRAVKIIHYRGAAAGLDDPADVAVERRTIREGQLALLLRHPNICRLHQVVLLPPFYYFFFELVEGQTLLERIIHHGKLPEDLAFRIFRQIVSAVDYCHSSNIVHRDLKLENIMLTSDNTVKLIDFGFSNLFSPSSLLSSYCGSLYFAAPELLRAKSYIGPEVDIWSMGVILYVLVAGKVPFDDENMAALQSKIKRGQYELPPDLSPDCGNLISAILQTDPRSRASMASIRSHPWVCQQGLPPPPNHVPPRPPLRLPLNDAIVSQMESHGLGTSSEIAAAIEDFIRNGRDLDSDGPLHVPIVSVYRLLLDAMI